jgi:uncharacterized membrane protein
MNARAVHVLLLTLLLLVVGVAATAQSPVATDAGGSAAAPASPAEPAALAASSPAASLTTPAPSASGPLIEPGGPVVRGVFFFSPTCAHCEKVITQDLPGFFDRSGGDPVIAIDETLAPGEVAFYLMGNEGLQLLMVDVSVDAGARMFVADSERLGLDQAGVPRVDIADGHFVGSEDIPARVPPLIDTGLAGEGIDWPNVPGLAEALAPFPQAGGVPDGDRTEDDPAVILPASTLTLWERVTRDPLGNGIAILVLIALLVSLVLVPFLAWRGGLPDLPAWPVPLLAVLGIAVSAYLGIVETNEMSAVCGPVGDCNAVQQSEYATLFGVPIGVLGVIGYALLLGGWVVARLVGGRMADLIGVALAVGALLGVAFSAYLTFLEPFVIGATCMWCVTSALTMLALLWLLAGPGWAAWMRLRGRRAELRARSA